MLPIFRPLLFLVAILLTFHLSQAQQYTVKGMVTDKNDTPLEGVLVEDPSASVRTYTNADGLFSIDADRGSTLIFAYFGEKEEQVVQDTAFLKIVMDNNVNLDGVVVLGSRAGARSRMESPVPVDVFDMEKLSVQQAGSSLSDMLNAVVPSFSAVTHSAMGNTDHVDPATLRGMSPDQTLVLLNGKRLHTSAMVHEVGGTNWGSTGTDLNTIPAFALRKIEVLRDGASAQYGSDAIAGVMDLQMKKNTDGLSGQVTYGGYPTKGADNFHGNWDGNQVQAALNYGTKIGRKSGFLNVTGAFTYHDRTSRSRDKEGQLYNVYNAVYDRAFKDGVDLDKLYGNINDLQADQETRLVGLIKEYAPHVEYLDPALQQEIQDVGNLSSLQSILSGDVTDQELEHRNLQRKDFNMHVGEPRERVYQLFFNTEIPLTSDWKVYGFGGYNHRTLSAAGYYRYPYEGTNLPSLFPDGYLPYTLSAVNDFTLTAGTKGKLGAWEMDLSNTIGENDIRFTADHTTNVSMRFNSPTRMKVGGFQFLQNTLNLDVKRGFDVLDGLNLAFGAEFRHENYKVKPGQPESYQNYDLFGNVVNDLTPDSDKATDFFGNVLGGGSQGLGGLNPENKVNKGRNSFAGYAESEVHFTHWLLLDGAIRYEHYSDFGSTFNFKAATLVKLARNLNLRFAGSTGFRAPSLAQIYYNTRSGVLEDGIFKDFGLFRNDSKLAELLGIPSLKEERSRSLSGGLTYQIPGIGLSFTADAFLVKVKDQIVLTGLFEMPAGDHLNASQQKVVDIYESQNISASKFFANAIDVRNEGADFVISHQYKGKKGFALKNDLGVSLNHVKRVGAIHASPLLEEAGLVDAYFDEHAKTYLERSTPRIKVNLMDEITIGKFDILLQNSYYGEVWGADNINVLDPGKPYTHMIRKPRLITDLSVSYKFNRFLRGTIGSSNIFDIYPSKPFPLLSYDNQFTFDVRVSQIPVSGRYAFFRLDFSVR